MAKEPMAAVGLLTKRNIDQLGSSLQQLWPVQDVPCFTGLLSAIDDADRDYWLASDEESATAASQKKSVE